MFDIQHQLEGLDKPRYSFTRKDARGLSGGHWRFPELLTSWGVVHIRLTTLPAANPYEVQAIIATINEENCFSHTVGLQT